MARSKAHPRFYSDSPASFGRRLMKWSPYKKLTHQQGIKKVLLPQLIPILSLHNTPRPRIYIIRNILFNFKVILRIDVVFVGKRLHPATLCFKMCKRIFSQKSSNNICPLQHRNLVNTHAIGQFYLIPNCMEADKIAHFLVPNCRLHSPNSALYPMVKGNLAGFLAKYSSRMSF